MGIIRTQTYGEAYVKFVEYLISTVPKDQQEEYKKRFVSEIKTYCIKPRKETEPPNPQDKSELLDILDNFDPENPEHFARFCKEGLHLMYNKTTSSRILNILLDKI